MLKNILKTIEDCKDYRIILLNGDLGSGKTYFVQQYMLHKYNFNNVSSPTFSLVNTYETHNKTFAHFDCYRKYNLEEILNAIMYSDIVFIEWFDIIKENITVGEAIIINCDKNTMTFI